MVDFRRRSISTSNKDLKHLQRNTLPRYTAILTFFRTRELKIASNKIPLIFLIYNTSFIIKSNTQVELRRNFEKLKMIHKQELRSFQPSGKSLIAEIEIEIAFTTIKFEIHTLRMYVLLYEILKREKFGVTREQNPFKH